MVDRFAEASSRELERVVEAMFEIQPQFQAATSGVWLSYAPVTKHLYVVGTDRSRLRLLVCKALAADAKYRREAPAGWPSLPISREDIKAAVEADDNPRLNVAGHFGSSLRGEDWSDDHPGFNDFVSGLMAYRHTPDKIRNDPELRRLFPPVRLQGLCAEWCGDH